MKSVSAVIGLSVGCKLGQSSWKPQWDQLIGGLPLFSHFALREVSLAALHEMRTLGYNPQATSMMDIKIIHYEP